MYEHVVASIWAKGKHITLFIEKAFLTYCTENPDNIERLSGSPIATGNNKHKDKLLCEHFSLLFQTFEAILIHLAVLVK